MLIQIVDNEGKQLYPAAGMKYTGLPLNYGYAAVPIVGNWEAGKKYTYVLDFSEGAGKVDPDQPEPDPDNSTNPDPDPFEPGDDILGHAIDFTLTVTDWDELEEVNAPMNEAITGATTPAGE